MPEESPTDHVSHSRLATFENCPLQYRFRYVDQLPRETISVEAFLGTKVHEALENFYGVVGRGRVPTVEELIGTFEEFWKAGFGGHVRVVRRNTVAEDYRREGVKCLRRFHAEHEPFDADETIGTELRVEADLAPGGGYRLVGFVDRLARARDGVLEIQDYKTSSTLPSPQRLRSDRQLPLYQIAVQQQYPHESRIRLVWYYLKHGRRLERTLGSEDLDAVREQTVRLIDRVRSETDFPPRESALCDWCEYQAACPVGQRRVGGSGRRSRSRWN